jgi:pyridoxal phosphate enzyme (YggS family)
MTISENLKKVKFSLPVDVQLIAVSKTKSAEFLMEAYGQGQRAFGENKVQELVWKQEELSKDIEWHFIGHLQTNKVKYIAPFVHLIHGVDSFKLLKAIDKEAVKVNRVISCLLQFHIAEEETKFGFSIDEATEMLNSEEFKSLKNISISGVMGMATYTDAEAQIRKEFSALRNTYTQLRDSFFRDQPGFREISMGMSGDYRIAVEEGSTMVRIGSTIFGERSYH